MNIAPITVNAIINGEKIQTDNKITRENPTHPEQIVGYAPNNTREQTIQAIDAAYEAFKTWAWSDVEDRIARMQRAIQKIKTQRLKSLSYYHANMGKRCMMPKGKLQFLLCGWNLPLKT